ncbi:hypothetical protein ACWGJP_07975 [Microbacterium sp. NPDC055903]
MNRSAILDGLWRAWPVVSWLLPALFSVHGLFSTPGGWAWSFLLLSALVLIPACGLLGTQPYRVLRRAGWDTAPWQIGVLLLVHVWAAFATVILAIDVLSRQSTDAIPSVLHLLGAAAPSVGYSLGAMIGTAVLAVSALAAMGVLARMPERIAPLSPRGEIAVIVAAVALPVLLVVLIAIGVVLTSDAVPTWR